MDSDLNSYRCKCGRLLFKGSLSTCKIEIKCKKCGTIRTIAYDNGSQLSKDYYVIPAGLEGRAKRNKQNNGNGELRKEA